MTSVSQTGAASAHNLPLGPELHLHSWVSSVVRHPPQQCKCREGRTRACSVLAGHCCVPGTEKRAWAGRWSQPEGTRRAAAGEPQSLWIWFLSCSALRQIVGNAVRPKSGFKTALMAGSSGGTLVSPECRFRKETRAHPIQAVRGDKVSARPRSEVAECSHVGSRPRPTSSGGAGGSRAPVGVVPRGALAETGC